MFRTIQLQQKLRLLSWSELPQTQTTLFFCDRFISTSSVGCGLWQKKNSSNLLHAKKRPDKVQVNSPSLQDFIAGFNSSQKDTGNITLHQKAEPIPYIDPSALQGNNHKVYFEVKGCQMNVNDTEIAWSILSQHGYERTQVITDADIVLVVTCAIRDSAERKVWNKIEHLKSLKLIRQRQKKNLKIGILGCMAERLKSQILDHEDCVDVIAGPDSYKDLPVLLASSRLTGQTAVNVALSFDETYADVMPVRLNSDSVSAFVSIMRGCDNMCSYCIVPFTRGRERSRPIDSIVKEVTKLSNQGVKEVMLLGQNVNSYRDNSISNHITRPSSMTSLSKGFTTLYRKRSGGLTFADLLDRVSLVDPEMRIRFTSPHPKDFPDPVLELIKERANICNQIHLPAQSGCSEVLDRMRRGYTSEAYIDLVNNIRTIIPDIYLSSDFITGFCGETDASHQLTMDLINTVRYNYIFVFPYSMRQKTHAYHNHPDNVPKEVKESRMQDVITLFRRISTQINTALIGTQQCVLVEKASRRSEGHWQGRNDGGTRVVFPETEDVRVKPGDYVIVRVTEATSQSLRAVPLYHTLLSLSNQESNQCIPVAL